MILTLYTSQTAPNATLFEYVIDNDCVLYFFHIASVVKLLLFLTGIDRVLYCIHIAPDAFFFPQNI